MQFSLPAISIFCESVNAQYCTLFQLLWTQNGTTVVYPCHAVVVAMQANNGHQRFFIGHTAKVCCRDLRSVSENVSWHVAKPFVGNCEDAFCHGPHCAVGLIDDKSSLVLVMAWYLNQ